ncbi:MAG: ATP-binding protein [Planctomycetota bacterium]
MNPVPPTASAGSPCGCCSPTHGTHLVVLTGGPGAGKTAVLEVIRKHFCQHVAVLPEAASILFGGGFPRQEGVAARRAAQRAIARVQMELERLHLEEGKAAVALCDRGVLDALAYWPGDEADLWRDLGTTREAQLRRYAAVIHLRVPGDGEGYGHSNPLRTETAHQAAEIDQRIAAAWKGHPRLTEIASTRDFLEKLHRSVTAIREEVPECCREHRVPELGPKS